jgi:uncharacterized membrane protein YbhN (UPF0104 family)
VAAEAARADGAAPRARHGPTSHAWWAPAKRVLTVAFFALVLGLVAHQARTVDWGAVRTALLAYPASILLTAAALALASFMVYCSYDLIGRHQTRHGLPTWQVAAIGFTSYAFNLNLGSLVGGVAFRYRLYSRRGLATDTITQVLALSMLTNWLGYLGVGGLVFTLAPLALPPDWRLGSEGLRLLGVAMLAAAVAYLATCAVSKRRVWHVRGREVRLPSGRIALLQLAVSSVNWLLIAAVVWTLLQHRIDYPTVLAVLLVAAVAGVITHVPAGLGVLEAVFVALLAHRVPQGELLAALVAYRAVYYLGPLGLACAMFLVIDRLDRIDTPSTT